MISLFLSFIWFARSPEGYMWDCILTFWCSESFTHHRQVGTLHKDQSEDTHDQCMKSGYVWASVMLVWLRQGVEERKVFVHDCHSNVRTAREKWMIDECVVNKTVLYLCSNFTVNLVPVQKVQWATLLVLVHVNRKGHQSAFSFLLLIQRVSSLDRGNRELKFHFQHTHTQKNIIKEKVCPSFIHFPEEAWVIFFLGDDFVPVSYFP